MPRAEMLSRMSSRELSEWIVYDAIEPFGQMRDELHAGIVASTVANSVRDAKKRPDPYRSEDFMPHYETPELSPEERAVKVASFFGVSE